MSERPNILLITTDQQRFDTISALGNQSIFTPHLDWLVHTGISFNRAYTDCPICMPARASIMTGLHAATTGLIGNSGAIRPMEEHPTLPGELTKAGYQTRAIGKMHFEPLRAHYGFEHMELLPDYYRHMARHPELGKPKDHGVGENEMEPVFSTVDDSNSLTHWTVDRTIDFIETRDESRPFFAWCSFAKPHPPFDPCKEYWDLYDGITLPDPVYGDWSAELKDVPESLLQPTYSLNNAHRFSAEKLRSVRRAYYACISQIDYNLGLLFARMREMDLLKNTWIIFTTDHGEMMGDHHLGAKTVFLEGAAHIPFLVRPPAEDWGPKDFNDEHCEQTVALVDIMKTCLDIAGIDQAEQPQTDGLNLIDVVNGKEQRDVLFGFCGQYNMVLKDNIKYHYSHEGAQELLFDLNNDPHEQENLIGNPAYTEQHQQLRQILIERLTNFGSKAVQNGELVSVGEPNSEKEVHQNSWPGFHHRVYPCDVLH